MRILTSHRAVNQRFSAWDPPVKKAEIVTWFIRKDIYGFPREIWTVWQCESWVSLSFQSRERQWVTGRVRADHSGFPLGYPTGREAEELLSGALKTTRCDMVKRRSYGSMWQSSLVSLSVPVSLTLQKFWLQERIKSLVFFVDKVLCIIIPSFVMAIYHIALSILQHERVTWILTKRIEKIPDGTPRECSVLS